MAREWNPIQREQQRELEKINICMEILNGTKQELYMSMRFFDAALNRMELMPDASADGIRMDGLTVYFAPDAVLALFRKGRVNVNRAYFHMILHCIFRHFHVPENCEERDWNLACDIVAESVIDSLKLRSVRAYTAPYRRNLYQLLKKERTVLTAHTVYRSLTEMQISEEERKKMELEFYVDDHMLWNRNVPPDKVMEREKNWREESEKIQTEMETFGREASEDAEALLDQMRVENRERYDYRKFLRKFAVLKEEMKVDMDTFDYIFYHYGMELYGNVPLIEPQETKETYKVEDFVIAIDTSMSCKGELVKRFLEETYSVLCEKESFFHKINVHIIQCDDKIQSDVLIQNEKELKAYMEHFEVKGQGGTDFRPVFGYVNELIRQKRFHRLRGLLYFTDGYGTFPAKRPVYETAFVFMQEDYRDVDVPVWAIKLIIEPEDLERKAEAAWT